MLNQDDYLKEMLAGYGIDINADMAEKFKKYSELLLEWNQKINLTAITDPKEIVIKHFVDSLLLSSAIDIQDQTIVDIGTGAGFPGIPLKIARPKIKLTLLDSLNKRLIFLKEVINNLTLDNVSIIHARAEDGAREKNLRENFSIATSRAVASLPALLEYTLPYVKVGGIFAAMKGPNADEEVEASQNALDILGGELKEIKKYVLPDGSMRNIVIIKKVKKVPSKYPRRGVKISKKPL